MDCRLYQWRSSAERDTMCLDKLELTPEEVQTALRVDGISAVRCLGLFCCKLPTLPDDTFQDAALCALSELHMGRNTLQELPESVGCLTQLTILSVQGNRLSGLPESLSRLHALTSLDAGNNLLLHLPAGICECTALRLFELSGKKALCTLPHTMSRLSNLQHLGLQRTPLVTPPEVSAEGARACVSWLSTNPLGLERAPLETGAVVGGQEVCAKRGVLGELS